MQNSEETIFAKAIQLPVHERTAYLEAVCGNDAELRASVSALLTAYSAGEFLEPGQAADENTVAAGHGERPGQTVGPYKLLQEIGQGGMGIVYMAQQQHPVERRVAVKIIRPGMDSRQVVARFEAERQALAMMDHPNIARVFDAGATDSGRPYFVMELVKGIPITQYCDEHLLHPRQRLELFQRVCHAIQHAHQKGIIHRDLKPSNVLVAEYDDRAVPKVIDFGVAKATQQRLTDKTMFTEVGTVVGTVEYMSPEQARINQLDIDTRSDIYSLGVLLYELLTGDTPFDRQRLRSAAFDEMLRIIREVEPSRPSLKLSTSFSPSVAANRSTEPRKLCMLLRRELDWIVMKALEKDRVRRYETANLLANDVQRYLNDERVLACPPSAAYRFRKFARRYRGAIAVATSLVVILLVVAIGGMIAAGKFQRLAARNADLYVSAVEAEAATREALTAQTSALERADAAGRDAAHSLFESLLAQSHASRQSGQMGQSLNSLAAVRKATAIAEQLSLGRESELRLRNEAVAAMSLPDLQLRTQWTGLNDTEGVCSVSPQGGVYATVTKSSEKAEFNVRRIAPGNELLLSGSIPKQDRPKLNLDGAGRFLCVRTSQTEADLWHVQSGRLLLSGIPCADTENSLDFSRDGLLLAAGGPDGSVRVYSLRGLSDTVSSNPAVSELRPPLVATHPPLDAPVAALKFNPDGSQIAVALMGKSEIELREVATGSDIAVLQCADDSTMVIAWDKQSQRIAAGMWQAINIWDLAEGHSGVPMIIAASKSQVTSVAFSQSGKLLISDSWDGVAQIWNTAWGQEMLRVRARLCSAGTTADTIAFSRGLKLGLWDVVEPKICRWMFNQRVFDVDVSPDGRMLAFSFYDGVRLFESGSFRQIGHLKIDQTYGLRIHQRTGDMLTSGLRGVYVWPVAWERTSDTTGGPKLQIGPPREFTPRLWQPGHIRVSRDGMRVIVDHCQPQSGVPPLRIYEATIGTANAKGKGLVELRSDYLHGVALSPNGEWAATGTKWGRDVTVWNADTGDEITTLLSQGSAGVEFSPDSRWVVTNGGDAVRCWSTGTWQLLHEFPADATSGGGIAFTHDSVFVAFARTGQGVRIARLDSGQSIADLSLNTSHGNADELCFTQNDGRLISVMGEGGVCVWDLRRIRQELVAMGLGEDLPEIPEESPQQDSGPVHPQSTRGRLLAWQIDDDSRFDTDFGVRHADRLNRDLDEITLAIERDPSDARHWYLRALIQMAFRRDDHAINDLTESIRRQPIHAHAYYRRGKIRARTRETRAAITDLERALSLTEHLWYKHHDDALSELAELMSLGPTPVRDPTRALACLDQLAAGGKLSVRQRLVRVIAEIRSGRRTTSFHDIPQVNDADEVPAALYDLVLALLQLRHNDRELALESFARAGTQDVKQLQMTAHELRTVHRLRIEVAAALELSGPSAPTATTGSPVDAETLVLASRATEGEIWRYRSQANAKRSREKRGESSFGERPELSGTDAYLLWCPGHEGALLSIPLEKPFHGNAQVRIRLSQFDAGGEFRVRLNGQPISDQFSGYSTTPRPVTLEQEIQLKPESNALTFEVIGRADESRGFGLAVHSLEVVPSSSAQQ